MMLELASSRYCFVPGKTQHHDSYCELWINVLESIFVSFRDSGGRGRLSNALYRSPKHQPNDRIGVKVTSPWRPCQTDYYSWVAVKRHDRQLQELSAGGCKQALIRSAWWKAMLSMICSSWSSNHRHDVSPDMTLTSVRVSWDGLKTHSTILSKFKHISKNLALCQFGWVPHLEFVPCWMALFAVCLKNF